MRKPDKIQICKKIKQIKVFYPNLPQNRKLMSMLEQSSENSNMISLEGNLQ